MDPILYLLVATGFGVMFWQRWRLRGAPADRPDLAEDADVALHLALHEARSRGHTPAPIHILSAVLQDDELAATVRRTGGDVDAIEDRIFAELEQTEAPASDEGPAGARRVVGWSMAMAARADRSVTCADLWAGLVQMAPETARLVESGGVSAADVLFTLVHGVVAAEEPAPESGEVEVILMNDDITPQELVVEVLRSAFDLSDEDSAARMMRAHTEGHGTVGRYPAAVARAGVETAQRSARSRGSPLRLRMVPAAPISPSPRPLSGGSRT